MSPHTALFLAGWTANKLTSRETGTAWGHIRLSALPCPLPGGPRVCSARAWERRPAESSFCPGQGLSVGLCFWDLPGNSLRPARGPNQDQVLWAAAHEEPFADRTCLGGFPASASLAVYLGNAGCLYMGWPACWQAHCVPCCTETQTRGGRGGPVTGGAQQACLTLSLTPPHAAQGPLNESVCPGAVTAAARYLG